MNTDQFKKNRTYILPEDLVVISLFAVLTAVGALIVIPLPFSPVPITLQTLFCILSGAILGKNRGLMSQVLYLLLGISGLPVFSKGGSGLGFLIGPTGGYLFGFMIGSYVCGLLVEKGFVVIGMTAGIILIYITGLIQLKFVLTLAWAKVFLIGAMPFIPGDVLKVLVGVGIYRKLRKSGILHYT